jgi:hypothetical protein
MRKWIFLFLFLPSLCLADSELSVGGKTAAAHIIQEDGTSLRPRTYLNFTGGSITCSDTGGKTVCATGGSGGTIGGAVTGGTPGSVLLVDDSGNLGQDNANLFFDDINNRLGIGTSSPASTLHVLSTTEQQRLGYNATNYFQTTVDSAANTTFNLVASSGTPTFTFTDRIVITGSGTMLTITGNVVLNNALTVALVASSSLGSASSPELRMLGGSAYANGFYTVSNVSFGFTCGATSVGTVSSSTGWAFSDKLYITKTTEQFRLQYDTSNYVSYTVGSTGGLTIDAVGSGSKITYNDHVTVNNNSGNTTIGTTTTGYGGITFASAYSSTNYALRGNSSGVTELNVQSSGTVYLKVNDVDTHRYNATNFYVRRGGAAAGTLATVGGVIFDDFADSTVGGAEADIYTKTINASMLSTNGDKAIAEYGGNFVTVGTELTQLKVYFAGTAIWDSTGVAPTTGTTSWGVSVKLIRVSATVVRYDVRLTTSGASGFNYCVVGELTGLTLTNTNILKITGTSTGVGSGSGDIVGKMSFIKYEPAA